MDAENREIDCEKMSVYEQIREGLKQSIAHARGELTLRTTGRTRTQPSGSRRPPYPTTPLQPLPSDTMTPSDFLAAFRDYRASAIVRTKTEDDARRAMDAAVRAGFRICEFTLTVPGALTLVQDFAARPGLIVGAGTVLTPGDARAAVAAGATFLVSPVVDPAVIVEAARLGVAVMPGCSTPTEMLTAHRAGAQLQKLFPAPGTGPAWVAQTLGPMPFLRIVPTSGVTLDNAAAYLRAGSFAVGFVNALFDPADIGARRFDTIEARGKAMLDAVRSA